MAAKRFLFGHAGRARLLEGSRILAGAVKPTLGPGGRNIFLERPMHGAPLVTKDGVTVAEHIELAESFANMGAQLVLESAVKTGNTAGDGTTTATVLAHAIYREGAKLVAAGYHPLELKRGIDLGVERVVEALAKMSRPVTGETRHREGRDDQRQRRHHDRQAGRRGDRQGRPRRDHSRRARAWRSRPRWRWPKAPRSSRGYSSAYFVTDMERLVARLDDPYILLCPNKIGARRGAAAGPGEGREDRTLVAGGRGDRR